MDDEKCVSDEEELSISRTATKPLTIKLTVELDDSEGREQLAEFLENLAKVVRVRSSIKLTIE